jgi:hypothetical protein
MKLRNTLLTSTALFCVVSVPASALPTHTWVSANGNDANAGTPISPYADFATAVANTAVGGTVSVMGPGDYGPVTITQSITIDGTGGGSINFAGDGEGIYIEAGEAANIVLKNLTVDGGGTGSDAIFVASSGTTNLVNGVIDHCLIAGFSQIGAGLGSESPMNVTITNTTITGGQLGVRTFQNGTTAPVTNNDSVAVDHSVITGASSAGVFTRNGVVQVTYSVITQSAVGAEADTYAVLSVANSAITSNQTGVCSYTTSKIRLDSNDIYDNPVAIEDCGGTYKTSGTNKTSGTISATPAEVSNSVLF